MRRGLAAVLMCGAVATPTLVTGSAESAVRACASGQVALTFDDGPSPSVTPKLLDALSSRRVPATFFVVGQRVAAAPGIVRDASRRGFSIANHTYRHEQLTRLGDDQVRGTLRMTRQAIKNAGAPPSSLMRPPYGLIDARVRGLVAQVGLTPVLWDIDPQDWRRRSSSEITSRVLGALRRNTSNVVLLHDGVGNSPNTLAAVPGIIRGARARGYCFTELNDAGKPGRVVPVVRVGDTRVVEGDEGDRHRLAFTLTLDRPTSRRTSVRVRTVDRSAVAGQDYAAVDRVVRFPAGSSRQVVPVRIRGDALDEINERLVLRLSEPAGLRLPDKVAVGTIRDDDEAPGLRLADADIVEPLAGSAQVSVVLTLNRPSGRWVRVSVATADGTAGESDYTPLQRTVWLPPGATAREIPLAVLADTEPESVEYFTLQVTSSRNVALLRGSATISIQPPLASPPE